MSVKRTSPWLHSMAQSRLAKPALRAYRRAADARMAGFEHIPKRGAALMVGNHAALGLDSFPFTALCIEHTGRMPRFLGERNLWRVPGLAQVLDALGAVPGTRDNAAALLRAGELVCVYPGGIDDSLKAGGSEYTLQWGHRDGFARVALRAAVPIIPFVGEGVDDLLTVVARERWIGRRVLGSPRYDLPVFRGAWGLPVPRRVPLVYHILEPIVPAGEESNEADVAALRRRTYESMESVLRVLRQMRGRRSCRRA